MAILEQLESLARQLTAGVAWLRGLPELAAAALLAAGLLGLVLGARYRRAVAVTGGSATGALAALTLGAGLVRAAGIGVIGGAILGAGVVAAISFFVPWAFPFLLGAVAGAHAGAWLPLGPVAGPILGAVAIGAVAVMAARLVAAAAAGLAGALLLVGGVLALSDHLPGAGPLARHPVVAVGLVLILAVAGAAGQLAVAWGAGAGRSVKRSRLEPPRKERERPAEG